MTNQVILTKSIPSSSWYTGSGSTSIPVCAEEITMNTKKSLIKSPIPQSPNTQLGSGSDVGLGWVIDLKRLEDTISIRGWLTDDTGSSAWNKAWQLRSMCSSGNVSGDKGALTSLVIDNVTMGSATTKAFLEEVTWRANPQSTQQLSATGSEGIGRIEINLGIYVGNPK